MKAKSLDTVLAVTDAFLHNILSFMTNLIVSHLILSENFGPNRGKDNKK